MNCGAGSRSRKSRDLGVIHIWIGEADRQRMLLHRFRRVRSARIAYSGTSVTTTTPAQAA